MAALEFVAPEGSFQLISATSEKFNGRLGNSRTRRTLAIDPVLPEDLSSEAEKPDYYRLGLGRVLDELPAIRAALPREGESFVVIRFKDVPLNPPYRDYTFTLSSQERMIGLQVIDPEYWINRSAGEKPKLLPPPPLEDIFKEIKKAISLQPKLKIPTDE